MSYGIKLFCVKDFITERSKIKIKKGDIINYTPRSKKTLEEERNKTFPIGAFFTDKITMEYLYIDELNKYFVTSKEYRKIKIKEIIKKYSL